jgi:alanine dehydrogenase
MKKGSVVVDVAIDQGGCFETSLPTSHQSPTFEVDGVIHYCVTNMPGAVARTSTVALTNATLSFVIELAQKGCVDAMRENEHLLKGLNIHSGQVTCAEVARSLDYEVVERRDALNFKDMKADVQVQLSVPWERESYIGGINANKA